MKHPSGAPSYGGLLTSPTNIRLDWKGLPGSNALAYYKKSQLKAVKSFITLAPGGDFLPKFEFEDFFKKIDQESEEVEREGK